MGAIRNWIGHQMHRVSESVLSLPAETSIDVDDHLYRLTGEGSKRDLNPLSHDRQREIAWYLWLTNPIAKDIIEKTVDFIVGEGVSVVAKTEEVQEVIDIFWDDEVNDMDQRVEDFTRELFMFGELGIPVAVNEEDGAVQIGYVDPSLIHQVKKDSGNALIDDKIILRSNGAEAGKPLEIIKKDKKVESETFGKRTGQCFYFAVNRASNGTRGNSDLLHIADWVDGYDQFLFARLERTSLLNTYIWDVTLDNANGAFIKQWLKDNTKITPGMIRAHNDKVHYEAVAPTTQAYEVGEDAKNFRSQMMIGSGFPETWLGIGENTNRAAAAEMNDPPIKRLTRKQKVVKRMIKSMIAFVIDQAEISGALTVPMDAAEARAYKSFDVLVPEMSTRDVAKVAAAINQAAQAMMLAEQNGWTTKDRNIEQYHQLTSHLGSSANIDDIKNELEVEVEVEEDPEVDPQEPKDPREYSQEAVRIVKDLV